MSLPCKRTSRDLNEHFIQNFVGVSEPVMCLAHQYHNANICLAVFLSLIKFSLIKLKHVKAAHRPPHVVLSWVLCGKEIYEFRVLFIGLLERITLINGQILKTWTKNSIMNKLTFPLSLAQWSVSSWPVSFREGTSRFVQWDKSFLKTQIKKCFEDRFCQ